MRVALGDRGHHDRVVHRRVVELRAREDVLRDGDAEHAADLELEALLERAAGLLTELVEDARQRARVAPHLAHLSLELVDLLDHVDRDHDVVVLELVDRLRVVEENVRVEHEDFLHPPTVARG